MRSTCFPTRPQNIRNVANEYTRTELYHLLGVMLRADCILRIHILSNLCVCWVLVPQIQSDVGRVVGVVCTILQRNKLGNFSAACVDPGLNKENRKKKTRPYKIVATTFRHCKISGKIQNATKDRN